MFTHNRNLQIDNEETHNRLEDMIEIATTANIMCYKEVQANNHQVADLFANIRDTYLDSYYMITGIMVDYNDLPNE